MPQANPYQHRAGAPSYPVAAGAGSVALSPTGVLRACATNTSMGRTALSQRKHKANRAAQQLQHAREPPTVGNVDRVSVAHGGWPAGLCCWGCACAATMIALLLYAPRQLARSPSSLLQDTVVGDPTRVLAALGDERAAVRRSDILRAGLGAFAMRSFRAGDVVGAYHCTMRTREDQLARSQYYS